jgi:hypothetical protein
MKVANQTIALRIQSGEVLQFGSRLFKQFQTLLSLPLRFTTILPARWSSTISNSPM